MVKPVLFVLGASALPLAVKLKQPLGAEIHTPDCVAGGDVTYRKATTHLGKLFSEGHSIIGLCAAGILIRADRRSVAGLPLATLRVAGLIGTPSLMYSRSGIEPASLEPPGTSPFSTASGFCSRS